jgi:hypothetical protein
VVNFLFKEGEELFVMRSFPKARVVMVTKNTLDIQSRYGFLATGGQLREQRLKTTWDLISDIISLRRGDEVLFWVYGSEQLEQAGIGEGLAGIFRIRQSDPVAFFDATDVGGINEVLGFEVPFRALIERVEVFDVLAPLDLLVSDKYIHRTWILSAKKTLGRGRSLTPLLPGCSDYIRKALREVKDAIGMWEGAELEFPPPEEYPMNGPKVPLAVNLSNVMPSNFEMPENLADVCIPSLPSVLESGEFAVEKALEAWLMENGDRPEKLGCLLDDCRKVLWFANYFPCTVAGVNIDAIILYESRSGTKNLLLIELKKKSILQELGKSIPKMRRYARLGELLIRPYLRESFGEVEVEVAALGFAREGTTILSKQEKELERCAQKLGARIRVVGYEVNPSEGEVRLTPLWSSET